MERSTEQSVDTIWRPDVPVDLRLTLAPLRHGHGDPTIRFDRDAIWRATHTPEGPASIRIAAISGAIHAAAWGEGREWLIGAVPRMLGVDDQPGAFAPPPGLLRDLARRHPGVRFGRTDAAFEALVPAVCEQKVTGDEAQRAYRMLVLRYGQPAPGPGGLRLPLAPNQLAALPYYALHPAGLEQRRADTLRRVASRAAWLEDAARLPAVGAIERLKTIPGVGPWTAAEAARVAFGDPDAISVGDYHLPHLVSWALAGEPRGDDARMLELLEPYRGHRARVARLLELSGIRAPRYGPRMAPRSIASI